MLLKAYRQALLFRPYVHPGSSFPPHSPLALRAPSTSPSRALTMTPHRPQAAEPQPQPQPDSDWSAAQYLKFGSERTRAVRDLVANVPLAAPRRIVDLGCGPGNSTAVLAARWPAARLWGVDASPDMLARARAAGLPKGVVEFSQADVRTWRWRAQEGDEAEGVDLLFSNAVLHWLRRAERIPTVLRLLGSSGAEGEGGDGGLRSGGVLAFQVPDNHEEPSHVAMREVAARPGTPWRAYFAALEKEGAGGAGAGEGEEAERPDLDPIETVEEWYDALAPACARVDAWHVLYQHALEGPGAIVEWVRATGLMPFLNALPAGEVREAYVRAYEARLAEVYPRRADGRVLLRYPRLFVVATKK